VNAGRWIRIYRFAVDCNGIRATCRVETYGRCARKSPERCRASVTVFNIFFFNATMALRKVKGNFERMFDKNLTDLVRGIRNNKENEVCVYVLRDFLAVLSFS